MDKTIIRSSTAEDFRWRASSMHEVDSKQLVPDRLATSAKNDKEGKSSRQPRRLTPIEKKERDRLRKREQAKRRQDAVKAREEASRLFMQSMQHSNQWHEQARVEEELVFRRLERDTVHPQRRNPAAAGYQFYVSSVDSLSPVFLGYSHAKSIPMQTPRWLQAPKVSRGLQLVREDTYCHPSCRGYTMNRENDSQRISPVFFLSCFLKVPLKEVELPQDEADFSDESDDASSQARDKRPKVRRESAVARRLRTEKENELQLILKSTSNASSDLCLVCGSLATTPGCPGCFIFSSEEYERAQQRKASSRRRTSLTIQQEIEDRRRRHQELKRQLVTPGFISLKSNVKVEDDQQQLEEEYYMNVLQDHYEITSYRKMKQQFVTFHIRALPVGEITTLCLEIKSSIAYLYELYRSQIDVPNRSVHILLPTTKGLFYFDERIESATNVLNGLVNGELLLEDFHLQSPEPSMMDTKQQQKASHEGEFMLFSVAVLDDHSTPILISNYVRNNFHLQEEESLPSITALHYAIVNLPDHVALDACQRKLVPNVSHVQRFTHAFKAEMLEEERRERELILIRAFEEKRKKQLERKQHKHAQALATGGQKVSQKALRMQALLETVVDETKDLLRPNVMDDRLQKLWNWFQRMEEWKMTKNGRLVDAERSDVTLEMLRRHRELTVAAFDHVVGIPSDVPLPQAIVCVKNARGGKDLGRLVLRVGSRLGPTPNDNYDYGIILDLDKFNQASTPATEINSSENGHRSSKLNKNKYGGTAKERNKQAIDQQELMLDALQTSQDIEWKVIGGTSGSRGVTVYQNAAAYTSSDLLLLPFYCFPWLSIAKAYVVALRCVQLHGSRLDLFNSFAKVLQDDSVVMTRAQIAKWKEEVEKLLEELQVAPHSSTSTMALSTAVRKALLKKGDASLRKRLLARKQQLRARKEEVERLRRLQEERDLPPINHAAILKEEFAHKYKQSILNALEDTTGERLAKQATAMVQNIAAKGARKLRAAKDEVELRSL